MPWPNEEESTAFRTGSVATVRRLIAAGLNPNNLMTDDLSTPVMMAAEYDNVDVVRFFIEERGEAPDGPPIDEESGPYCSPFTKAAVYGAMRTVLYLHGLGANVDSWFGPDQRDTALTVAVENLRPDLVRLLLALGAKRLRGRAAHRTVSRAYSDGYGLTKSGFESARHEMIKILSGGPTNGKLGLRIAEECRRLGIRCSDERRPLDNANDYAQRLGQLHHDGVFHNGSGDFPVVPKVWELEFSALHPVTRRRGQADVEVLEFAHFDGGNYALAMKNNDPLPWDPEVFVTDHDDNDLPRRGVPLSDVLATLKPTT